MFLENAVFLPEVCQLIDDEHTVTILARGNSMRPFIESDRDEVIIGQGKNYKVGDVVLAEISKGHFVLHRIDSIDGENVVLRGDGNYPGTESCKIGDIRAKMLFIIRKGKQWSVESNTWKIYSKCWVALLPIRRYLLALYRLLWRGEWPNKLKRLIKK